MNRHPATDVNVDVRPGPGIDFVADFEKPLPIRTEEWDGVLSIYCLEHISWRMAPHFISEVYRVLKGGGIVIFVTPNIEAQFAWAQKNKAGWDGKEFFQSASEIIFGSLDYPDNTHKSWISPDSAFELFQKAGFQDIDIRPAGARNTDMVIQAYKPEQGKGLVVATKVEPSVPADQVLVMPREEIYDWSYFNGGRKVGGYGQQGYWDFPIHEATVQQILKRKPESVLELGCARGYVGKRLEDKGIPWTGLEISRHCWLTRASKNVINHDVCETPWPIANKAGEGYDDRFDLCFSIAFLEHVPEDRLPMVIAEMERTCKRGLHGIDFGQKDDGFDRSHVTLKDYSWWRDRMPTGHEIVDKQELEKESDVPQSFLAQTDKEIKLNVGCGLSLYHRGWINIDAYDLSSITNFFAFGFLHVDACKGLPYPTGVSSLIHVSHLLEFITYPEARELFKELRRVVKNDGLMRVAIIDSSMIRHLDGVELCQFDEIDQSIRNAKTDAEKVYALLIAGKQTVWDRELLLSVLGECGWDANVVGFRESKSQKMLTETVDSLPAVSCYVEAVPRVAK